jgi:23S rRNA (uridine2552-2'-O)-methyltransferase
MGKKWRADRKKDFFYKKAKADNYRSRASFKLLQINKKFRLIKKGDYVLDLGAAPGGWMQVAREVVGDRGRVVGVDLEEIMGFEEDNINLIQGDINDPEIIERIKGLSQVFDVVISDASPDISGAWDVDHFNSIALAQSALNISRSLLKEGGNFLVKVFQGDLLDGFVSEVKKEFEFNRRAKPEASRKQSAEVYVVGCGLLKTPVRYGDMLEVVISESTSGGSGVALYKDFKILVEDGRIGEKTKVKIKKVSRDHARGIKI